MAAIAELAYIPNAAAQALSGRPPRLVGAVVGALDDPVTTTGLASLARELATQGVGLMLAIAGEEDGAMTDCARGLVARGVAAIVFCGGVPEHAAGAIAPGLSVPCASLDDAMLDMTDARSGFERAKALVLGARYLLEIGHARVGFLAIGGQAPRHRQLQRELAAVGIPVFEGQTGPDSVAAGQGVAAALERWRAMSQPPTAIVCGSDAVAAALLDECRRRDLAVPAELSIIGLGDTELSRRTRPSLSTLRIPAREAGKALAGSLLATLRRQPAAPAELFAKLVARESTAPNARE
jgi:LacI family transcriptional regulator